MRVMAELLQIRWAEVTIPVAPVTWTTWGGVSVDGPPPVTVACDFCGRDVESAVFPVFDGVRGKLTWQDDGRTSWIDGPFGACTTCQSRLGIRRGDQEVELAKVQRLFSLEVERQAIAPVKVNFYGPG